MLFFARINLTTPLMDSAFCQWKYQISFVIMGTISSQYTCGKTKMKYLDLCKDSELFHATLYSDLETFCCVDNALSNMTHYYRYNTGQTRNYTILQF